jgi:signal-transduction protein with cAMP-binding, CBS, and nucleotidyltransferase domain
MKKNVTLTIDYDIYEQARKKYKNLSAYFQRLLENMLKNDTEDYLKSKKDYKAQQRINKRKIKKMNEKKAITKEEQDELFKIANFNVWSR